MTMVPRDPITVQQISAAKGEPSEKTTDVDDESTSDAEVPTKGSAAAPSRLPGSPKP